MTDQAGNDGLPPFKLRIPPWVALIFFAPMILAIVIYYVGVRSLNGTLIPEPGALPAGVMTLPNGTTAAFRGRWALLYVGKGECDKACKETLSRTREAHQALGEERPRVQRFFIATSGTPDAALFATSDPDLVVLTKGLTAWDEVIATLGEFAEGDVFVADPLGNVLLRFPAGMAMKDMHQDLTVLLNAAQNASPAG